MHTKVLAVGNGRFALDAAITVTPAGIAVVACSSGHAHIGATAQAIPRPEADRSATVSILAVPCHRDEIPAHDIASSLATRFRVPVVASCGLHIDNATGEDIDRLLAATQDLIHEIADYIDRLRRSAWDDEEDVVTVTRDGIATGIVSRSRAHAGSGMLHRAFATVIVQTGARGPHVMLCRRSPAKQLWPSVLSDSCAGHTRPSETLESAVQRRLQEEIGLSRDAVSLVQLGHVVYRQNHGDGRCECEWCAVFGGLISEEDAQELSGGCSPQVNTEEVSEVRFVPFDEIEGYLDGDPEHLTPWLALALRDPSIWGALRSLAGT
ncbi:NUDIX hydrolase [Coriobacterium glomerans PW2]|uniref:isopentenyl-diphosphate Delta-isomerase n=1 Tax=Coriobacterium glomerans (strain ATCC 49209 / DSM 20642 / JCM 10262 / PW2) TaxID=700015 RepID=F2N9Z3_CORGP|nr:NUDIX domain-containing protein [Coriobacterium glomerans]AEB06248.1 NUDIX hydrolase [Coriobacterium glomerans PW2]